MTPDILNSLTNAAFAVAGFILGVLTMCILVSGREEA